MLLQGRNPGHDEGGVQTGEGFDKFGPCSSDVGSEACMKGS